MRALSSACGKRARASATNAAFTIAVLLTLTACGGGGSSGGTDAESTGSSAGNTLESRDGHSESSSDTGSTPSPTNIPVSSGRLLASNCFQCHGTNGSGGFERLSGEADEIREFLNRSPSGNIMAAHAQGYTPAQIDAIVAYFKSNR